METLVFRTKEFAVRIIRVYGALPRNEVCRIIGRQFVRSGTSVGAHCREAFRSRSDAEWISKMEVAPQELDETQYWLELLIAAESVAPQKLQPLMQEIDELLAITVALLKTVKAGSANVKRRTRTVVQLSVSPFRVPCSTFRYHRQVKKRAIVIVCDSLGVGELPDAHEFGDEGSNTLGHVIDSQHPKLPTLTRLGLLHTLPTPATTEMPAAAYGRMAELSAGKDTTTGHWEMMGLVVKDPFRTYPNGFPAEIIREYERRIGRKTLGNKPASGTVILDELGEEHMRTGAPIVYTSGDSVFQVAAHEDVIPVEELWRICAEARELMRGEHNVGRIIARPFLGSGSGQFKRTANRKDFSVRPTGETVLERAHKAGREVIGLGKIADIFDRVGIGTEIRTESNSDGMRKTMDLVRESSADFIFTNLVDFDSKYGHRNDPIGYARALEAFDGELASLLETLQENDLVFITADHGCDPTDVSTDHTREYVPLVVAGPRIRGARPLGTRSTFGDLGATICELLELPPDGLAGTSVVGELGVKA